MLVMLIGKTCSGKNTIVTELKKRGWDVITTYTTRPIRKNERDGVEYRFISNKEFLEKEKNGDFIESKSYSVNGNTWFYGSPKEDILKATRDNNLHVIILTPAGVQDICKQLDNKSDKYQIYYLYADRLTILKRLNKRKDSNDSIKRRMDADEADFKDATNIANKIIYNDDARIADVANKIAEYSIQYLRNRIKGNYLLI